MKSDASQPETVDEYIAGFPPDVQDILREMRARISKIVPDAEEAMKYQIPTFVLNGNLVHFGAFRNHIGFYPTPSAIEAFRDELAQYQGAKGSIRFPLDQPMPWSLIEKIVRARVKQAREKSTASARHQRARSPRRVILRLIVQRPVPGVQLRVQRGRDGLLAPVAVSDDAVTFEFSLEVKESADGSTQLRGAEVQGGPAARFVYVTVGTRAGQPDSPWDRRAKVSLMGMRAADIAAAIREPNSMLVGAIEGRGRDGGPSCASVPLLGEGWSLVTGNG